MSSRSHLEATDSDSRDEAMAGTLASSHVSEDVSSLGTGLDVDERVEPWMFDEASSASLLLQMMLNSSLLDMDNLVEGRDMGMEDER